LKNKKKLMKNSTFLLLLIIFNIGFVYSQAPELDPKTGYFKTSRKASITEDEKISKDSLKQLIVIQRGELIEGMTKNMNFFKEILTVGELEREIVNKGLQDKVPSLDSFIGLSNAARHNRPFYFLYIKINTKDKKTYAELRLLNPTTGKDIFVSEYKLQSQGGGYLTKYTYSPLFNSFIDYINSLE
jgi:hypothetical protein